MALQEVQGWVHTTGSWPSSPSCFPSSLAAHCASWMPAGPWEGMADLPSHPGALHRKTSGFPEHVAQCHLVATACICQEVQRPEEVEGRDLEWKPPEFRDSQSRTLNLVLSITVLM